MARKQPKKSPCKTMLDANVRTEQDKLQHTHKNVDLDPGLTKLILEVSQLEHQLYSAFRGGEIDVAATKAELVRLEKACSEKLDEYLTVVNRAHATRKIEALE
jgi:hypothetical protein